MKKLIARGLALKENDFKIDIWSYPSTVVPHMDIAVSGDQFYYVESVLNAIDKRYEIIVEDLQKYLI